MGCQPGPPPTTKPPKPAPAECSSWSTPQPEVSLGCMVAAKCYHDVHAGGCCSLKNQQQAELCERLFAKPSLRISRIVRHVMKWLFCMSQSNQI